MNTKNNAPLNALRHHVTGAIERGEAVAIAGIPNMDKPTAGPWTVTCDDNVTGIYYLRTAQGVPHFSEDKANARLMAASKEMFEALQVAAKLIPLARGHFPKSIHNGDKFALENACATIGKAIAKAEGRLQS
jgi:hypothetical protein